MEPTELKLSEEMALVSAEGAEAEAYQRAPTLMAGETAGSQGKVRVWAPNRRFILLSAPLSFFYLGFALFHLLCSGTARYVNAAIYLSGALLFAVPAIQNFFHPCYISTDESGIAITTRKGSQAFRWKEILSFEDKAYTRNCYLELFTSSASARIELTGYSTESQHELLELVGRHINRKAHSPQMQACRGMKGWEPDPAPTPLQQPSAASPISPLSPSALSSPQMRVPENEAARLNDQTGNGSAGSVL